MHLHRKILKARRNKIPTEEKITIGRYPICAPSYTWVPIPEANDPLPPGIVSGGQIETGEISYIGRGRVDDQTPSGFFTKETRQLHVPYGCIEHQLRKFDMLVVDNQEGLSWEKCERGHPPSGSQTSLMPLPVTEYPGYTENMLIGRTCTPLTDGRTNDHIALTLARFARTGEDICRPGKIHQSHECLYVPYSGREYHFHHHEMLMMKPSPGKLKHICRYVILNRLKPVPLKKSVEKLPLPGKMKKFLEELPDISRRVDYFSLEDQIFFM